MVHTRNSVRPPTPEMLLPFDTLEVCPDDARLKHELLDKLVILKLNGGLGTTLGCQGPKSAIEVRQGLSFLDLTVRQVEYLNSLYGVDVPLVLMNSFNTHEETVRIIRKYRMHNLSIHTFNQVCSNSCLIHYITLITEVIELLSVHRERNNASVSFEEIRSIRSR